ncbi:MAG: ATP-binding cassette domain-containing protein [Sulfolobales archaeon]|nr:ATP-binding cassette domain-containing protein [Sulfolobales archaeon]
MKAIEVREVVKIYGRGFRALDGVSLDVEEGSIHALLGPNGAGKTTLIRIITTQLNPNKGSVKVFGYDTVKDSSRVRKLIGYVPQEVSLWGDLSGYENMLLYARIYGVPKDVRSKRIEELIDFMELSEAADKLVRNYSGGMIRRLEIAIALMTRPRLLVLDEPTIGLDPRARSLVWSKISEFRRESEITVFFATHYMDEADKYADSISLLNQGNVVAQGTPNDLKNLVGGDKVSIVFKGSADKVAEIVSTIPGVLATDVKDDYLELTISDIATTLPLVIEKLYGNGLAIREFKVREVSLDEVFIKLTGRRISDELGRIRDVMSMRRMISRGR